MIDFQEIFVCENIAALAQTAHQLKHHVYNMFCHAQQKVKNKKMNLINYISSIQVAELQALNPTAEATELISAICGDTAWLQEVKFIFRLKLFFYSFFFSYSIDLIR